MRKGTAIVGLLFVATPIMAQTAPSGPTERGSMLIAGSASVTHTQREGGSSATNVSLHPSILYFIADRVALGGQLGVGYTAFDDGHGSNLLVGPAARLFFGAISSKTQPYLGVAGLRGAANTRTDSPVSLESDATLWGVEGLTGIAFMISRQVGITGEAYWRREESTVERGQSPDVKETIKEYGLRFGVAAFLF